MRQVSTRRSSGRRPSRTIKRYATKQATAPTTSTMTPAVDRYRPMTSGCKDRASRTAHGEAARNGSGPRSPSCINASGSDNPARTADARLPTVSGHLGQLALRLAAHRRMTATPHGRNQYAKPQLGGESDSRPDGRMLAMASVGVLAHFEFKNGKEAAAQQFFDDGKLTVEDQPPSTRWYAFRIGPNTYGAFAVFARDEDREALLSSGGPRASRANAELFETEPSFQKVDIIAAREGC